MREGDGLSSEHEFRYGFDNGVFQLPRMAVITGRDTFTQ